MVVSRALVVELTAMTLTGYSDCLTCFCELFLPLYAFTTVLFTLEKK